MLNLLNLEILSKTVDDMPIGIGIFHVEKLDDLESIRYVFMNKLILFEMRKSKEEVFGKRIIEVAPEAYEHEVGLQVIETYRNVARDGESVNLGIVEYSNSEVAGLYECSVHPIQDKYIYVMLRNVTELEQSKKELEEANQELEQFAYIASHDLQEPLRTINSFIELLRKRYGGKLDQKADKSMEFIADASKRMSNLVKGLLEHSRIGHDRKIEMVDCQELVETVKKDLSATLDETNTRLEIIDLPTIQAYGPELRMLFQNLISNGIKFHRVGVQPYIRISAEKEKDWIFKVEDNGIGIESEFHEQIFGLFERLHPKMKYKGSGIGLAHCQKIVDMHNGKLWLDSKAGEGSIFYFSIPESVALK